MALWAKGEPNRLRSVSVTEVESPPSMCAATSSRSSAWFAMGSSTAAATIQTANTQIRCRTTDSAMSTFGHRISSRLPIWARRPPGRAASRVHPAGEGGESGIGSRENHLRYRQDAWLGYGQDR